MTFLNRTDELQALLHHWESGKAEFFVLYGRRRVGKSELVTHFGDGKNGLYFEATNGRESDHLEDLRGLLLEAAPSPMVAAQPLQNWTAALAAVEEAARGSRFLLILDEFQFIARESPEIGSLINRFLRKQRDEPTVMLVISGSDLSFFEEQIMGYSATMYGRRTGSLKLQPFRPREIDLFLNGWKPEDLVRAYAVFGGMPYYLDGIDPSLPLAENIFRLIFSPTGMLREEPTFLLSMESRLRTVSTYSAILRALAAGRTRVNEIAQRIGEDKTRVSQQLQVLGELGLVRRVTPVTANPERSKTVIFQIGDPFLRFWYRFVLPYQAHLHHPDRARRHVEELVMPQLDDWVANPAFEEICQEWLFDQVPATKVGWWWGKIRERDSGGRLTDINREVDAVALDADGRALALGACKWTNKRLGYEELEKLKRVAEAISPGNDLVQYHLFSRSGWSESVLDAAHEAPEFIKLVHVDDLYR